MKTLIDACRKFNIILSTQQKKRVLLLGMLMVIGGLLETLSVTIIMPFMQVVVNPATVMNKPIVHNVCDMLGIHSDRTFLVLLSILIAVLYLFKNVFLLMEYNFQYKFVHGNRFYLQSELLDNIIHRPYEYFLHAGSGDIMRILNWDVEAAFDMLVNLLNLFTELIVSGMLIITIFVVSPTITICIAVVLIVLLVVILIIVRPKQAQAGRDVQMSESGKNKWLLQAIQGIKEIKVAHNERFFQDGFERYAMIRNDALRRNQILTVSPRFFIEAASMATMFVVIGVMIYRGSNFEEVIPILTVVAMAAIRILPAVNRIAYTMSNLEFNMPKLNSCIENISSLGIDVNDYAYETDAKGGSVIKALQHAIDFRDVRYRYSGGEKDVLSGASMTIDKGNSVGIVGASGSGKTTAVDLILGVLRPQEGAIYIDGVDVATDLQGWISQVGYIPQTIFMMDGSIRDNILFGSGEDDLSEQRIWHALGEAALEDFVRQLPDGLDTEIGERGVRLSGGQRQRIGIARALYRNPEVLVFDEATSALDNETENSIMEAIHGLHGHKTMIIIAHRLSTIEDCDHIYRVENGRINKER